MQITQKPFRPLVLRAPQTAVTTSVQSVQVNPNAFPGSCALRLVNIGTAVISFSFSNGADAGLTATNGHALLPNTGETFWFSNDMTHINFVASATGSTLSISIGEGA
mgnify:FL=1